MCFCAHVGRHFCPDFQGFAGIFSHFAQIFRDSAQIFNSQNFLGCAYSPASYTTDLRTYRSGQVVFKPDTVFNARPSRPECHEIDQIMFSFFSTCVNVAPVFSLHDPHGVKQAAFRLDDLLRQCH